MKFSRFLPFVVWLLYLVKYLWFLLRLLYLVKFLRFCGLWCGYCTLRSSCRVCIFGVVTIPYEFFGVCARGFCSLRCGYCTLWGSRNFCGLWCGYCTLCGFTVFGVVTVLCEVIAVFCSLVTVPCEVLTAFAVCGVVTVLVNFSVFVLVVFAVCVVVTVPCEVLAVLLWLLYLVKFSRFLQFVVWLAYLVKFSRFLRVLSVPGFSSSGPACFFLSCFFLCLLELCRMLAALCFGKSYKSKMRHSNCFFINF